MARRYELTDEQYALIADLMPSTRRPGGRWNDHRTTLDGILWILYTGAQWRELPERYGRWKSVYDRLNRWSRDGTIGRFLERLQMRLDAQGRIDLESWCIDGTSVRASRSAAGARGKKVGPTPARGEPADHAPGRSRGGLGTKVHLVVSSNGVPLSAVITAGQAHESKSVESAMVAIRLRRGGRGRPRSRPRRLAGDKGYSYARVREDLRRRGIKAAIPTRKDQRRRPRFDKAASRRRNIVERCIGWLKENRRVGTRFEKLATNFLAMVKLAMMRQCLRMLESPDTA